MDDTHKKRFGGIERLYGKEPFQRFTHARVMIVGLGGVGSWTVEALARSAIGHLILVDMDDICVTNTNRQLPALVSTVGHPKAVVLEHRIKEISPACHVTTIVEFLTSANAGALLDPQKIDVVVDATDNAKTKAMIIDTCRQKGLPVVTAGAAGGKKDPTRIKAGDLGATGGDALLKQTRRELRRSHGWPQGENIDFHVPSVYSPEPIMLFSADGSCAATSREPGLRLDCAGGLGAACPVTGTFGFVLASEVLRLLQPALNSGIPAPSSATTNAFT